MMDILNEIEILKKEKLYTNFFDKVIQDFTFILLTDDNLDFLQNIIYTKFIYIDMIYQNDKIHAFDHHLLICFDNYILIVKKSNYFFLNAFLSRNNDSIIICSSKNLQNEQTPEL